MAILGDIFRQRQKRRMEDALKHLYECERRAETCTVRTLGGALNISAEKAASIFGRLQELNLVKLTETDFGLTPPGRREALRIVRIHRLWERYLADETSVPEEEWHPAAEKQEHKLTSDEANRLSEQLGHPLYDPHGEPIPSQRGEMPPRRGLPLSKLDKGAAVRIIEIEDDPESIYKNIRKAGLSLGMPIEILEKDAVKMGFKTGGTKIQLSLILAAYVRVEPLREDEHISAPVTNLSELKTGQSGEVVSISRACRGTQRRRLMDLGIIPGTVVSKEMVSAAGDPVAYNVRDALLALRNEQAELIYVKKLVSD